MPNNSDDITNKNSSAHLYIFSEIILSSLISKFFIAKCFILSRYQRDNCRLIFALKHLAHFLACTIITNIFNQLIIWAPFFMWPYKQVENRLQTNASELQLCSGRKRRKEKKYISTYSRLHIAIIICLLLLLLLRRRRLLRVKRVF